MQAAFDGAREVWGAVLAATLTTVIVFVPILLIEEEAGQLFRDSPSRSSRRSPSA